MYFFVITSFPSTPDLVTVLFPIQRLISISNKEDSIVKPWPEMEGKMPFTHVPPSVIQKLCFPSASRSGVVNLATIHVELSIDTEKEKEKKTKLCRYACQEQRRL